MTRYELKLPEMGESVIEATITAWLKKVGDTVEADESVVEVATDKVDSEVPSEVTGVLKEILFQPDDVVQVGQTMAIIETDTEEDTSENNNLDEITDNHIISQEEEIINTPSFVSSDDYTSSENISSNTSESVQEIEINEADIPGLENISKPESKETVSVISEEEKQVSEEEKDDEYYLNKFYSPLVRNIAKKEGITLLELNKILGTGLDGRVTKEDILMYLEYREPPKKDIENIEEPHLQEAERQDISEVNVETETQEFLLEEKIEEKEELESVNSFVNVEQEENMGDISSESNEKSEEDVPQTLQELDFVNPFATVEQEEISEDISSESKEKPEEEVPQTSQELESVNSFATVEQEEISEDISSESKEKPEEEAPQTLQELESVNPFINVEKENEVQEGQETKEFSLQDFVSEEKIEEKKSLSNLDKSSETEFKNPFIIDDKEEEQELLMNPVDVEEETEKVKQEKLSEKEFVTDNDKTEPKLEEEEQPIQIAKKTETDISIKEGEEIIPMSRMGKMIAEHMIRSKQTSAHVQSFTEADVTRIWNWRNRVKGRFETREKQKFTFTPIFMSAVAKALQDFPMMNISVEGDQIIKKENINIGMATALPDGNLIVPVIKNADRLSLTEMAKVVNDLANRARNNELKPDEVKNGTYTVTNIGSFGNVFGTPIINQPQVGILALGAIRKVPAVIETPSGDAIAIRYKMMLSHSYDHRVVNGALGGMFVQRVAEYLENWDIEREV